MKHRKTTIQTTSLLKHIVLLITLLTAVGQAWATDYVFYYTNGSTTYYLARNGTTGVTRVTTFDASTCVWSCYSNTSGTTASLDGSNSRYLAQTVDGTRHYLTASCTRSGTYTRTYSWTGPGLSTTASQVWRSSDNNLYAYYSSSSSYSSWNRNGALNLNSSTPSLTDNSTSSNGQVQVYYAVNATLGVSTGLAGSAGGTVAISSTSTAGTYGTTATLSQNTGQTLGSSLTFYYFAQPIPGYEFIGWTTASDGTTATSGTESTKTESFTAQASKTYYAIFRKLETKATVEVAKTGEGTIHVSQTITEGTETTTTYTSSQKSEDHTFYIFATPNTADHYVLSHWTKVPETATDLTLDDSNSNRYKVTLPTASTWGDVATYTYTANYRQLKHFQFSATATATLEGAESATGGTASVSLDKTDVWAANLLQNSETATATFTATPSAGYAFIGWTETLGKKTPDVDNNGSQFVAANLQVVMTNTAGGMLTKSLYAIFSPNNDPTAVAVSTASAAIDKGQTQQISLTFTPATCYKRYTFASSDTEVATVDENGLVTGVKQGTANITVTVYRSNGNVFKTETVAVTVKDKLPTPAITITQNTSDPTTATATIAKGVGSPDAAKIYYTTDGSEPTASSTEYTEALTLNNNKTLKAIVICTGWYDSDIASKTFIARKTATPVITIAKSGDNNVVSFSCDDDSEGGITYYYTLNGDTPTTSSTAWDGNAFTPTNADATIKVIATHTGWQNSDVVSREYSRASGTSGGVVYLNDLEDHNWTYYLPNGGVDASYNYPDKLCSPYPRNVKISYYGNGLMYTGADGGETTAASGVQVSGSETENTFMYYKTLERDANNRFPYQLIPNPFSKRPTYSSDGTTKWRGFYKWRVKSVTGGTIYNASSGGTAQDVGALLDAETEYYFQPTDNGQANANNAISMQVELEAVWARAYRVACAVGAISTNTSSSTFTGGSVERNFLVVNDGTNSATAINNTSQKPVTIMMVEPDFSSDYRTSTRYINPKVVHANADLKLEYMNINGQSGDAVTTAYYSNTGSNSTMFWAGTKNLTLGRGLANTTSGGLVGYNISGYKSEVASAEKTYTNSGGLNYHVRVESGVYNFMTTTQQWKYTYYDGAIKIRATWGCDYDRAKGDNSKFTVKRMVLGGNGTRFTDAVNKGKETIRQTLKSGILNSEMDVAGGDMENSTYFGICGWHSNSYTGCRTIIMEGGEVSNLCGGSDRDGAQIANTDESVRIRLKGGKVRGCIYGGATSTMSIGTRTIIMTGGEVNGWISGGNNGVASTEGELDGMTYVYIGGNAVVNSNNSTTLINRSLGGNVFGSGCGYSSSSTSGKVDLGSNVVVADNSYIERGVYGGGSFGFNETTSNIYITGGHINGKSGGVSSEGTAYDANIQGGVYGGACQNKGGNANIYMTGGIVEGGIYGGSNSSGTLSGNVTIHVDGGQIGTSGTNASVHGGGYGSTTVISQNVDITLGRTGQETNTAATIYGDVYGGSSLGKVNGTSAADTYHTNVTLNAGTINGSLYGGALGDGSTAANVYGPVAVKVYGGSVQKTSVLGSGGVYGCNNVNGAPQKAVTVDIYGTDPAPAADQYALYSVYGGGNKSGYTGTPVVTVHNCNNSIKYVYGGGNAAPVAGTDVTIWGGDVIGNVFGGGNGSSEDWPEGQTNPGANVTTNGTKVQINGGTILNVFGGSNTKGLITGGISVVANAQQESGTSSACSMLVSNVFGAGNLAPYTGDTNVQILNGTVGNVFGGGKGSATDSAAGVVTGNSVVIIGDTDPNHVAVVTGSVFGGGDYAELKGTTNLTVEESSTKINGDIYGGGNASNVQNTITTIHGGTIGNVYGGGRGTGDISADVGTASVLGDAITNIYGGSFGGIFGAGNIKSNVTGKAILTIDDKSISGHSDCPFEGAEEVYGAGNLAEITGKINFSIGCISGKIKQLYGGAKNANINNDIVLNIVSGKYGSVYGGNNLGGDVKGGITINVQHSGCSPIEIDSLYGGGNLADYNTAHNPSTEANKNDFPVINIKKCGQSTADWVNDGLHCLKIGAIYGAGKGVNLPGDNRGKVTGNPHVNVYAGEIGTIFGGGNAADVVGNTYVKIIDEYDGTPNTDDHQDIYITGNVYGGGSAANVTGKTNVQIGKPK